MKGKAPGSYGRKNPGLQKELSKRIVVTHPPKKKTKSNLGLDTFKALKPFVNLFQCGRRHVFSFGAGKPFFMVTKEQWRDYDAWKRGAYIRDFNPRRLWAGILSSTHVRRMLAGQQTYYFTSANDGLGMAHIDLDAHEPWQDDLDAIRQDVLDLLGAANLFESPSDRGLHLYLKVDYRGGAVQDFNAALDRLQAVLKKLTARRQCVVEVQGKAGDRDKNGTLGKLPCTGRWDYQRLHDFEDTPVRPLPWLLERLAALEAKVPAYTAAAPKQCKVKVGSYTGTTVPAEALATLPDLAQRYKSLSYYCFATRVQAKQKRTRIVANDFAIALALIKIVKPHLQRGTDCPQKLIRILWGKAFADGIVDRAFDCGRWSAIWQTLANQSLLTVESEFYWYHPLGSQKGQCMAWAVGDYAAAQGDNEETKEEKTPDMRGGPPRPLPGKWTPTWLPWPRKGVVTAEMEAAVDAMVGYCTP